MKVGTVTRSSRPKKEIGEERIVKIKLHSLQNFVSSLHMIDSILCGDGNGSLKPSSDYNNETGGGYGSGSMLLERRLRWM